MTRAARSLLGVLAAGSLGAMPASLFAQGSPAETPRLLVVTFRSPEKGLGADAAEEVRNRLQHEIDQKKLLVIPKAAIEANLKASGFNPDSAPDPITSRLLAQALRADQYVDGTATRTADGYRIDARIVLASNNNMVQPVPPADDKKLGDAAKAVAKAIDEARQQLDDVMACQHAVQAGQFDAAVQSARKAITTYPQSTTGRDCLAQAYVGLKMPPDSIIAVTSKVVQIDPKNKPALGLLAQAYKDAGNVDKAVETWTTLLSLDPKNVELQTQVVNVLAASGKAELAKPIITKAVADNPNDPDLIHLEWLIMLASKDWKQAIQAGEQWAKIDTAATDTTYFQRLAAAYSSDSQPQKAAEVTSRAVAKFPNSATLWALNAQMQRQAGQTQQSIDAAHRALALNPKDGKLWLALAQTQVDLNQPDSAIVSLKQALANGADSSTVGTFLMVLGKHAYDSANASKALPDFQRSAQLLSLADSVAPQPPAEFLLGVSQYYIGALSAQQNQKDKSCDLANQAADAFTNAQMNITKGGSVSPDGAKQLLDQITKFDPAVKSQVKAYCKKKK